MKEPLSALGILAKTVKVRGVVGFWAIFTLIGTHTATEEKTVLELIMSAVPFGLLMTLVLLLIFWLYAAVPVRAPPE